MITKISSRIVKWDKTCQIKTLLILSRQNYNLQLIVYNPREFWLCHLDYVMIQQGRVNCMRTKIFEHFKEKNH